MDNDNMLNMINENHRKKMIEAQNKSLRISKINSSKKRRQKVNRNRFIASLLSVVVVASSSAFLAPKIDHRIEVKKAINNQKQQISMMLENSDIKFSEDYMLGMIDLFGEEGANMVAQDMGYKDWKDWCRFKGYYRCELSSSGAIVNKYPDLEVAKNYLESEAINKSNANGGKSK